MVGRYGICAHDGKIIYGSAEFDESDVVEDGDWFFRWTEVTGMELLFKDVYPRVASPDGSVVAGNLITGMTGGAESTAVVWDAVNGLRNLGDLLTKDFGLDLSGWTLSNDMDGFGPRISDDGSVIVGFGMNPFGEREAWMVSVPEPTGTILFVLGLSLCLGGWHHRRTV